MISIPIGTGSITLAAIDDHLAITVNDGDDVASVTASADQVAALVEAMQRLSQRCCAGSAFGGHDATCERTAI